MPGIAIIGGGISGLYAALLLEQRGIEYVLLESRDRLGGRVSSVQVDWPKEVPALPSRKASRFDLGATWYWPGMQPQLAALVAELGLRQFGQHEDGDMLIERSTHRPASRLSGFQTTPPSVRISGGMVSLVEAIAHRLRHERLRLNRRVNTMNISDEGITILATNEDGQLESYLAQQVLLAVPPQLVTSTIRFKPLLPASLSEEWKSTDTWMAPHAKYVAVYRTPFWREHGLSGEVQSTVGPLGEIHDASTEEGHGALFGFFGIPAQIRSSIPEEELKAHCRSQFARLFGKQAEEPEFEFLKDWAQDSHTATGLDQHAGLHQASAPQPSPQSGDWKNRIFGIASEWSEQFPGYIAGAIDAAQRGIDAIAAHTVSIHQSKSLKPKTPEESS